MVSSEQFFVALGAVVPLFILISIGLLIRRFEWLTDAEVKRVNAMVFKAFFSTMMFYNLYTTNIKEAAQPALIAFSLAVVAIEYIIGFVAVCHFVKGPKQRGAIIQGIYRSNFVLMGIPLVTNIFGAESMAVTTMMIAIVVPIYNVLAVFTLETFRGGKFSLPHVLLGVLKNPMIIGALVGLALKIISLPLPAPILKPLAQITAMVSPLALIILGASFRFSSIGESPHYLATIVVSRLIVVPAIALGAAVYYGFRGVELATLVSIFATPCAVAGFSMAQLLDSDADLAGNAVVFSTAFSCITIFCWLLALAAGGWL